MQIFINEWEWEKAIPGAQDSANQKLKSPTAILPRFTQFLPAVDMSWGFGLQPWLQPALHA